MQPARDLAHRLGHCRRQLLAEREDVGGLDADHPHLIRHREAGAPADLERGREVDLVAADQPRAAGDSSGVELVDAAWDRVLADHCIDEDRTVETVHQVEQLEAPAIAARHGHAGDRLHGQQPLQLVRHRQPGGVVAEQRVAEPDNHDPRRHLRSQAATACGAAASTRARAPASRTATR
ncbi:MAG: hypothetical protein C3F15_08630 [Holophagae bacterium]|nr:MAG: hypothetical protein C3F15_08630 [Holophagae bacterium]